MNFANFLRTPFLQTTFGGLLFQILLQCNMIVKCLNNALLKPWTILLAKWSWYKKNHWKDSINFSVFNLRCCIEELMMNLSYNLLSPLVKSLAPYLYSQWSLVHLIPANNLLIFQYNRVPEHLFAIKGRRKSEQKLIWGWGCFRYMFIWIHSKYEWFGCWISNIGKQFVSDSFWLG